MVSAGGNLDLYLVIGDEYLLTKIFDASSRINHHTRDTIFKKLIKYATFEDIFIVQEVRILELAKTYLRHAPPKTVHWAFETCIESLDPLCQSVDSQKLISKLIVLLLPRINNGEETDKFLRFFALKTPFAVPRDTIVRALSGFSANQKDDVEALAFKLANSLSTLTRLQSVAIWKWADASEELCKP